jgi:hypothetical protein
MGGKIVKITKTIAILSALPFLALVAPASAQTDLTCNDVTFNYEMTSRFPDIQTACIDVIEVEGDRFAQFSVELVSTRRNNATFRFKDPDDGSYGPTQSVTLDPNWRAEIGGREYRVSELSRGQELNIYLPSDKWEAHVARNTTGYFAIYYPVAMADEDSGDGGAMLPSTAGFMPLFALFGGAALFSAFMIRIFRRR